MASVLEGVRVVDFGQYLAGPMTAMFLADYGADVIRVDPPGGPRWDHPVNAALQRGKRSIELDLKQPDDLCTARQLVRAADIVIEGFRPGVMERLGLSPEVCRGENSRLIWCSLPGFGHNDPRAGIAAWEGVVSAAASLYPQRLFVVDGDPGFTALPLASTSAAFVAAHRIAAALVARHRFGRGEHIEVPLFDASFEAIGMTAEVPTSRTVDPSLLTHAGRASIGGMHVAGDGRYFEVDTPARGEQVLLDEFFPGVDILTSDDDELARVSREFEKIWLTKPAAEWERMGQALGANIGQILTSAEWLADEHAATSKCVIPVDDPELGHTRQGAFPVLLSQTQPAVHTPRHTLDSDRAGILEELASWPFEETRSVADPVDATRLPLEGIRVFDASILLAGPTTTRVLAQYGAEVIKIEKAGVATGNVNPLSDDNVLLFGHRTVNAGKRMMFLDLKSDAGQQIAHQIIAWADVVHHNFTPATAERLGLGLADVREANADAVYATTSLHSVGGFREYYHGHEHIGEHIAGVSHRLGGDGVPRQAAIPINDNTTGHLGAFGILLALFHRYRSGETQEVNAALSRTSTMLQLPFMIDYDGRTSDEPAGPDALGWHAFNRLYRASDGWFYMADQGPRSRDKLASIEGLERAPEIADADIDEWLQERFATRSTAEWVSDLQRAAIGAHRYLTMAENLIDDTTWDRGLVAAVDHPGLGRAIGIGLKYVGGIRNDATPIRTRRPGMDTIDILEEHGFGAMLPGLLREGVVAVGENPVVQTTALTGFWNDSANVHRPSPGEPLASFSRQLATMVKEGRGMNKKRSQPDS